MPPTTQATGDCRTCGYPPTAEQLSINGAHVQCPRCQQARRVKGTCDGCHAVCYSVATVDAQYFARSDGASVDPRRWMFCSWRCLLLKLPHVLEESFGARMDAPGFLSFPFVSASPYQVAGQHPRDLLHELELLNVRNLSAQPPPAPRPLTKAQARRAAAVNKKWGGQAAKAGA